ncbi:hypothetical protein [Yersinia aleksiciae]|uniref:Uncharacterized protein n=1 Tax=Yersinia aleksiciae TaxID=263819 RepID=A0A0T9UH99_YERAE|nr:hypothetical protein [Yersinia aleksiciae]CNL41669.1 Uncharacterised protein [Yersinia aleksiciae]
MDIFEQICHELNIEGFNFDRDNILQCELKLSVEEPALLLSLYRNYSEMSLCLSVTTRNELPEHVLADFLTLFAESAIQPFCGGIGIGVLPGNGRALSAYKCIMLAGYMQGDIQSVLADVVEKAEFWDEQLMQT